MTTCENNVLNINCLRLTTAAPETKTAATGNASASTTTKKTIKKSTIKKKTFKEHNDGADVHIYFTDKSYKHDESVDRVLVRMCGLLYEDKFRKCAHKVKKNEYYMTIRDKYLGRLILARRRLNLWSLSHKFKASYGHFQFPERDKGCTMA